MSSRRVPYASCFRLPCPVAKTIDRTRYPPSPAGDRPHAPREEGHHGSRSPPVARGLAPRPAGQGQQPAGQRACSVRQAPVRTWLLRGMLSKGGASPSLVGAHAGHASEVEELHSIPPQAVRRAGRHGAADGSAGADIAADARPTQAPSLHQGLPRVTFHRSPHRCTQRAANPDLLAWGTRHRRWRSAASRVVDPLTPPALRFNAARGTRRSGLGESVTTCSITCSSSRTWPGQ
jgi:hypothetical protein